MVRVREDAVDRRPIVLGGFAGDLPARVAVAAGPWEIAARDLEPNAMARADNTFAVAHRSSRTS